MIKRVQRCIFIFVAVFLCGVSVNVVYATQVQLRSGEVLDGRVMPPSTVKDWCAGQGKVEVVNPRSRHCVLKSEIDQVLHGQPHAPEINEFLKKQGNPDFVITHLRALFTQPDKIEYTYEIKNVGSVDANLDQVAIQAVVSSDQEFSKSHDWPAGGKLINNFNNVLKINRSIKGSFRATVKEFDPKKTPYLILTIDWHSVVAEENEDNNYKAVPVEYIVTK